MSEPPDRERPRRRFGVTSAYGRIAPADSSSIHSGEHQPKSCANPWCSVLASPNSPYCHTCDAARTHRHNDLGKAKGFQPQSPAPSVGQFRRLEQHAEPESGYIGGATTNHYRRSVRFAAPVDLGHSREFEKLPPHTPFSHDELLSPEGPASAIVTGGNSTVSGHRGGQNPNNRLDPGYQVAAPNRRAQGDDGNVHREYASTPLSHNIGSDDWFETQHRTEPSPRPNVLDHFERPRKDSYSLQQDVFPRPNRPSTQKQSETSGFYTTGHTEPNDCRSRAQPSDFDRLVRNQRVNRTNNEGARYSGGRGYGDFYRPSYLSHEVKEGDLFAVRTPRHMDQAVQTTNSLPEPPISPPLPDCPQEPMGDNSSQRPNQAKITEELSAQRMMEEGQITRKRRRESKNENRESSAKGRAKRTKPEGGEYGPLYARRWY